MTSTPDETPLDAAVARFHAERAAHGQAPHITSDGPYRLVDGVLVGERDRAAVATPTR